MQTIELDCPPGAMRPADLIESVIKGTVLTVTEHPTPFFGEAVYEFDIDRETWVNDIQPVIKPRIEALYHSGMIRYGSW